MDSDDENEETPSWKGVPGIVVLINVYDPSNNKTAAVAQVATLRLLKQYLRLSGSGYIGVCLYGIEDKQDSNSSAFGLKNVVNVFPLTLPTLDDFQKLEKTNIVNYGQAKDFIMSDALWHCSKMFANCKKQLSSRIVILLTKLDIPPTKSDQKPTFKRVVDLMDSNIEIKIINISEHDYKIDPFYENFLIESNKAFSIDDDVIIPKPVWDSREIEKLMHQESHRHLAVARLNFQLGNDISIGVGVYNLLKASGDNPHKKSDLDRDTNAIVTRVNKTMKVTSNDNRDQPMDVNDEENEPKQVPLLKSELLHYQQYGGERIEFSTNEMAMLTNPFGPPMMKLLGFKPASAVSKEKWFLKMSHFLFPNESIVEGSTVAFKALHKACVEMGTVAICVLCTRKNAKPKIVALSPCTNPLGLNIDIGFDVIHIPFMENVRDIPMFEDEEEVAVSDVHKGVMKDTMRNLMFDYKPDMFENPKLQSEYRAIEAIALNETSVEPFIDTTKPNSDRFEKVNSNLFEETFGPFGVVALKRSNYSSTSSSEKRQRIENDSILDHVNNGTVNKFTVSQLKQILRDRDVTGLPALTGLKKQELVDLVYKHCKE